MGVGEVEAGVQEGRVLESRCSGGPSTSGVGEVVGPIDETPASAETWWAETLPASASEALDGCPENNMICPLCYAEHDNSPVPFGQYCKLCPEYGDPEQYSNPEHRAIAAAETPIPDEMVEEHQAIADVQETLVRVEASADVQDTQIESDGLGETQPDEALMSLYPPQPAQSSSVQPESTPIGIVDLASHA